MCVCVYIYLKLAWKTSSSYLLSILHTFVYVPLRWASFCPFFFIFLPSKVPVTLYLLLWTPVQYYLTVGCELPCHHSYFRAFLVKLASLLTNVCLLTSSAGLLSSSCVLLLVLKPHY